MDSFLASGNNFFFPEFLENPDKHLIASETIMKPVKSQFQCVGHHVPIGTEDIDGKGPGGDLGVGDFLETILPAKLFPEGCFVGHEFGEGKGLDLPNGHFEELSNFAPDIFPTEEISVGDVENLVRGLFLGRAPDHRTRQMAAVANLVNCLPCPGFSRKSQGQSKFFGNQGIDGQAGGEVHRGVDRKSADGVRPQRRPCP